MATCDCILKHTNKGICNCQDNLSWEEEKWKWEEDTDKKKNKKKSKRKKMNQLSDKNKKNREDNPFDSFLPPDTQWENFKLKWLIGVAVLLILGGLLLMVKDVRSNPTSLPFEGCYYFSQKHFDKLVERDKQQQSYYSITINKKEFTLYTNDIKVWNSYRKEYPDAYLIKCYTEEDSLNSGWKDK